MHRHGSGYACAMCKTKTSALAFSVLLRSYDRSAHFDEGFVPRSAVVHEIQGSFPVCTECAPACPRCKLPVATKPVVAFGVNKQAKLGAGVCRHKGLRELVLQLLRIAPSGLS